MKKMLAKTALTSRLIGHLLPELIMRLNRSYQERPGAILDAWPMVVGPALAPMTRALRFHEGVLYVAVSNATLYSLLTQYDKARVLQSLREKFPKAIIKTVVFKRQ